VTAKPNFPTPELASVTTLDRDDVSLVQVAGEIDMSNSQKIGQVLTRIPNQALGLVLDLRQTTFLDSSAISLLHDVTTRMTERSQLLVIVCASQSLPRRVLSLTGVDTRAQVVEDVEQAMQYVLQSDAEAPSQ
jgi:anti-sigma B factor antagonist